jgi:hypothetical protein
MIDRTAEAECRIAIARIEDMDIFRELEFSQEWIDLGIVSQAKLNQIEADWLTSDDKHSEHYRWRAFLDFMQLQVSLDPIVARRLYELGASDPDSAMGGSIMAHVLRRKDCPEDLLREAATSEEKFLRKIASERLAKLGA